jgi:hypothetical protein
MAIWLNKHQVCNGFPPPKNVFFQSAVKRILLLIFLHGLLFCSPELFIYRYMYRNVHTLPPGRVILYFFPLKPCHYIHDCQNGKCRTYLHNKWLTMFFKTRGLFSVISHRRAMRVDWEKSSRFKKHNLFPFTCNLNFILGAHPPVILPQIGQNPVYKYNFRLL